MIRSLVGFALVGLLAAALLPRGSALAADGRARAPVPAEAEQQKALGWVREYYSVDYSKVAGKPDPGGLARTLLEKGDAVEADPVRRFAFLSEVRDLAQEAGDIETTLEAIRLLAESYKIDGVQMKLDGLVKIAKVATSPTRRGQVAEALFRLIDEALAEDQFELAGRIANLAYTAAQRVKDTDLIKQVGARRKFIKESQEAYADVATALGVLEQKPLDPQANFTVGRYRALVQGDWDVGLPMLALGSDATLQALAIRELESPSSSLEQAELADKWWELAEKDSGVVRKNLLQQADTWYRKALPDLGGVIRGQAEQRLQAAAAELGKKEEFALNKWADLLPGADARKHAVRGMWRRVGSVLVCDAAEKSLLLVPVAPDGNYDLKLKLRRLTGKNDVGIVIPVGSSSCFVLLSAESGKLGADESRISGIGRIDGKWEKENPTVVDSIKVTNNQDYVLDIHVKLGGEMAAVAVSINSRPSFRWQGPQKALSVADDFRLPVPGTIGLWGRDALVHFAELKLRMLSGTARKVQWEAPPPVEIKPDKKPDGEK